MQILNEILVSISAVSSRMTTIRFLVVQLVLKLLLSDLLNETGSLYSIIIYLLKIVIIFLVTTANQIVIVLDRFVQNL